jgi:hypothetical protein
MRIANYFAGSFEIDFQAMSPSAIAYLARRSAPPWQNIHRKEVFSHCRKH